MCQDTLPSAFEKLLKALLYGTDIESVPGDFAEIHRRIHRDRGRIWARCWYIGQIACLLPSYLYHQIY